VPFKGALIVHESFLYSWYKLHCNMRPEDVHEGR